MWMRVHLVRMFTLETESCLLLDYEVLHFAACVRMQCSVVVQLGTVLSTAIRSSLHEPRQVKKAGPEKAAQRIFLLDPIIL